MLEDGEIRCSWKLAFKLHVAEMGGEVTDVGSIGDDAKITWSIEGLKKFKGDCDVYTASQCCITTGTLMGVLNLDIKLPFSIKDEDEMADVKEMSLRDVLMDVKVDGKPPIRVLADVDASTVLAISATGADRDAALENICQYTPSWAMYTLMFEHKAVAASVEVVLKS